MGQENESWLVPETLSLCDGVLGVFNFQGVLYY